MNQARNTIFNNIHKSLGRNELDEDTLKTLKERLANPKVHELPYLGTGLIDRFINQLKKVAGTLESIPNAKDIPFAVLEFLQKHNLPQEIVVDTRLKELPWPNQLRPVYRAAEAKDVVSVSKAFAGIVETGSLVLLSSPDSPTTLNFLPDNHIVVLYKDDMVTHIEKVWTRLRTRPMPRTVNIITGPSRTADIEQTIQLGAHGPRRLHIIFVKQSWYLLDGAKTSVNPPISAL
ncbi:MAG: lactate utilization protein C [Candidatus Parabeggiatoa sp. nov. 2]|nr:MAG: lactate utilization protein C [Gammaproteobacteria bacterium]